MRIIPTLRRYALAAGVTLAALGVHLAFHVVVDSTVAFLAAVMIAAWFGGFGPGLLVAVGSGLLKAYFVLEPVGSFWLGDEDLARLTIFVLVGVLACALHQAQQREARTQARLLAVDQEARSVAEHRTRANARFLAVTSHELRTPLEGIVNWIRVLEAGVADRETTARALLTIRQNAHRQARLIDDLLDMTRLASGKLPMSMVPIDPASIVADAIETIRPAADTAGVTLVSRLESRLPAVRGDAQRLSQIVLNLLSNAVKYTPAGGVVDVSLAEEEDGIRLVVSDTAAASRPTSCRTSSIRSRARRRLRTGPGWGSAWRSCANWCTSMAAAPAWPARDASGAPR